MVFTDEAQIADVEGEMAAKEKEAELLRQYEAAVHRPPQP